MLTWPAVPHSFERQIAWPALPSPVSLRSAGAPGFTVPAGSGEWRVLRRSFRLNSIHTQENRSAAPAA
jgi:hypothetical protein